MRHAIADVVDALEGGNDFFVVCDDDDGRLVLARHLAQDAHHRQGALRIERRRGFVGQDDGRAVHQAAGNGHALLLAARQLCGAGVCALLYIQRREQLQRPRARRSVGHARQHGQQGDVVDHV